MSDDVVMATETSPFSRRRLLAKGGLAAASVTLLGRPTAALADTNPVSAVPAHGRNHGIGGSDPLLNGLVVSDQGVNSATNLFSLSPRTSPGLTFPVATLRAEGGTNQNFSLDLMPKGRPGNFSSNGICWIDICDTDALTVAGGDLASARIGVFTDHVEFGSRGFGSILAKPIFIGVGMDGSIGTAQIRISPGLIVIGAEKTLPASSVVLGSGVALAPNATQGFTELPSMPGTPTGVAGHGANVPVVIDTTAGKLWARIGGAWKSVTFA
jgi:hypothetical protein